MKRFIYGALSAFSVVAAYHFMSKKMRNTFVATSSNSFADNCMKRWKNNNVNCPNTNISNIIGTTGKGRHYYYGKEKHDKIILDRSKNTPKHVSFKKEYIEERKKIQTPSGLVLTSSRKNGIFFFKHDIQNVIENTDDKIVIFDLHEYFKPVLSSFGFAYVKIGKDELKEDIMEKYDRFICDENVEYPNIAPLTERITCFNVQNEEDVEAALRYVFMKSKVTVGKEYPKRVWLYIPSWEVTHYHSRQLFNIMRRSRIAGVIMTAAAEIDSLIINDNVRYMANMHDFLAFTDDIDNYSRSDAIRELICRIDEAYQFDINISQEEANKLKHIVFKLEKIDSKEGK